MTFTMAAFLWTLQTSSFGLCGASASSATVGFVDGFAQVQLGADSVVVQLKLVGDAPRGAIAVLGAFMDHGPHRNDSGRVALQLGINQTRSTAVWPPSFGRGASSDAIQSVLLSGLSNILGPSQRALTVQIVATAGATVDTSSSTLVLSLDPLSSFPLFSFVPNRVVYPGGNASISIKLGSNSSLTTAATLKYKIVVDLSPPPHETPSGFLLPPSILAGFIVFRPGQTEKSIEIPIKWAEVPENAQYRLTIVLQGLYNALTERQPGQVALFIFGVMPGTCPPGTAVSKPGAFVASSSNPASQWWQSVASKPGGVAINGTSIAIAIYANGSEIPVSSRRQPIAPPSRFSNSTSNSSVMDNSTTELAGMVAPLSRNATLCIFSPVLSSNGTTNTSVVVSPVSPAQVSTKRLSPREDAATSKANQTGDAVCLAGGGMPWSLEGLLPGTNTFDVTVIGNTPHRNITVPVTIVKLADPSHSRLLSIQARGLNGLVVGVCDGLSTRLQSGMSPNQQYLQEKSLALPPPSVLVPLPQVEESVMATSLPACVPDRTMMVTIPSMVDSVNIVPQLLHPNISGVRVEINGQVLSRGGNVSADVATDTGNPANAVNAGYSDSNGQQTSSSLPAAYVIGLQPGVPVGIKVVVLAEDGVTSSSYPMVLERAPAFQTPVAQHAAPTLTPSSKDMLTMNATGWPATPAEQGNCTICPVGWASANANSTSCTMCPPGTAAPISQSSACTPCVPGTYALSWGSSQCRHCIAGTVTQESGATACNPCPSGTTTPGDGFSVCNITLPPMTDIRLRYAVVVEFSVNVSTGSSDPSTLALRAGVAAPAETILGNLLRSDTATNFNISEGNVVVINVSQVARRVLQANVSAVLGVDVPPGSSSEDAAAALEVQRLSADKPIELLSKDPNAFFGRTTKTLDVGVTALGTSAFELLPLSNGVRAGRWAFLVPAIASAVGGFVLIGMACLIKKNSSSRSGSHSSHGLWSWMLLCTTWKRRGRMR